ncbi:hypothetical protein ABK905_23745 [Acerihabitans sp. KWT182]|uniref:Uncharacterized protein n=1 Tax=Acerihabitans sp. KWT182 TaxID=3157919 RepID=A0AAU7Q8B2_9GAMM
MPATPVPFTEDVKRTLVHLVNTIIAYEADRFSLSLLHKAGIGIPFSLLSAAHSFYRVWRREENIGTVLIAGMPFFAQAILPHSENLRLLANFIKNHIEHQFGNDPLCFAAADGECAASPYLGLGILALMGEYYLRHHPVPTPTRAGLKLPVALARLFSHICRYWPLLCAASTTNGAAPADESGRMALSASEKREQREGRVLARLWASGSQRRQAGRERIAQSYYGIETPALTADTAGAMRKNSLPTPARPGEPPPRPVLHYPRSLRPWVAH